MPAADLLVGPLLRRVVGMQATIWVETSAPATVTVRTADGATGTAPTFSAYQHHYALVVVSGLTPDTASSYEVLLDGEPVWPLPGPYRPSVIRTRAADDQDQPVRLVFGSCREATQHATGRELPPDALDAYARGLAATGDPADLPDLLVLLGDQVYADETSPTVRRLLRRRRRRPVGSPVDQVVSFDEYTKLYLESWCAPETRWLLSTVPSVMIFDDHEVVDDWNTSAAWRAHARAQPWWGERISSGLASYWVYQHLGNLAPAEIAADPLYAKVTAAEDATDTLREFGHQVDRESDLAPAPHRWRAVRYRWSFALDVGRTRLVMLDNRCGRVLEPGRRAMLPPGEWSWLVDQAHGSYDHLVVGSSLPWLLPPGIHHVEAWNEVLADSHRHWVADAAEKLRRAVDLEHWAAFRRSFDALGALFARIGGGASDEATRPRREPGQPGEPASISVLSGDVHHSYVARARFADPAVVTPVHQLTCSPLHNQVPDAMRLPLRLGWSPALAMAARALSRTAGTGRPALRWTKLAGPYFGNAIGTLRHDGRTAEVTIAGTTSAGGLQEVMRHQLTSG
ncbi:alkaline phosphatase D family protein [Salinispora sp. H7-4]|uniref:alkaline phosphatase D family protein n=1 Tax=Salinispora sp. H7-4 TaxID=2748321 RepID=UPI0015D20FF2|nr:alkaline phosphatase D family protein [Salinispora sp. H7-4]NYT93882.1 alkaline phosphatase family protein [Salinispora sp. H7-4]